MGFNTCLALPKDLYHIFERLDFLSGEKSVSLKNRGDGIKARHIPLIFRFMAEKKAALQKRGGQPISSIWAYLVCDDFKPDQQIITAQRLCQKADQECRATLAIFQPLLRDALAFLRIEGALEIVA